MCLITQQIPHEATTHKPFLVDLETVSSEDNNNDLRRRHHDDELHLVSDNASVSSGSQTSSGTSNRRRRKRNNNNKKQKKEPEDPVSKAEAEMNLSVNEKSQYLALDCEMVGVGFRGKTSALARVTLVDWDHNVILDEYVRPDRPVTDYRTFVSGITKEQLDQAELLDLESVREKVLNILNGKILVGHALKNDMRALNIHHPWQLVRDTAKYEPFQKARFNDGILWPQSLKTLSKNRLNRDIQIPGVAHCPKEDAASAMDLYKVARKKWEKAMEYKLKRTQEIVQKQP